MGVGEGAQGVARSGFPHAAAQPSAAAALRARSRALIAGMKKRFTEEQIIGFLKQAEGGVAIKDLCRKHGFSDAAFYTWRRKFGGMEVADAKRLKALEAENAKLKKLLAESLLDNDALKVALGRKP